MKKQYWSLSRAVLEAKKVGIEVTKPTLIKWCKAIGIGFQLGGKGGKWYIFPEKYKRYLNGGKIKNQNPDEDETKAPVHPDEEPSEEERAEEAPKGGGTW